MEKPKSNGGQIVFFLIAFFHVLLFYTVNILSQKMRKQKHMSWCEWKAHQNKIQAYAVAIK